MPVVQIWEQLTMSVPVISRDLSRLLRVRVCQRKMRAGRDAVNHTHHPLKWCWCLSRCDLGACCEPACLSTDLTTKRSCKRLHDSTHDDSITVFAFTFMHLADSFFQGNLHCIQGTRFIDSCFPWDSTLCSTVWATGDLFTAFIHRFFCFLHVFLYRSLLNFCYGHFNVF